MNSNSSLSFFKNVALGICGASKELRRLSREDQERLMETCDELKKLKENKGHIGKKEIVFTTSKGERWTLR